MESIKGYFTYAYTNDSLNNITNFTNQIASILVVLGYVVAVIMVLYIGIRYTIARPAEKAQLKTQLTYLAIGAIVLTAGTTVLGFVGGIFASIFSAPGWQ